MSQPLYYQPPPPSNGLGTAGFVVSLVLCPIGLVLSLVALRRPPRGLAVAGLIIGGIGTLIPLALLAMFGVAIFSCFTVGAASVAAARPHVETALKMQQATESINQVQNANGGTTPTDIDGNLAIGGKRDGWGQSLRYRRLTTGGFEIRSAGEDKSFNTLDDQVTTGGRSTYGGGSSTRFRPNGSTTKGAASRGANGPVEIEGGGGGVER